jgi:hypothetical protein
MKALVMLKKGDLKNIPAMELEKTKDYLSVKDYEALLGFYSWVNTNGDLSDKQSKYLLDIIVKLDRAVNSKKRVIQKPATTIQDDEWWCQ